ncbi:MAG: competence/damage-inducible protein A, partial [Muribaculaceae bacterium]|nr:competence/damage-inducible protein A [Muribaculaceae bacterium]
MKAYIIAIGKELLLGNVADINTSFIANLLSQESFEVAETAIIDDNPDAVEAKVRQALGQADIVLLTGGLGPTKDDLTRDALMRVFGGELRRDEVTAENVARIMAERSRPMNALTAAQAIVPSSARIIQNPVGTAPILWFETQQFAGKVAVAMPGVPFELREVFANHVLPQLKTRFRTEPVFHAFLQTHNISESAV